MRREATQQMQLVGEIRTLRETRKTQLVFSQEQP